MMSAKAHGHYRVFDLGELTVFCCLFDCRQGCWCRRVEPPHRCALWDGFFGWLAQGTTRGADWFTLVSLFSEEGPEGRFRWEARYMQNCRQCKTALLLLGIK